VPAKGFYEWKTTRSGKQPFYIRPKGDELFGLAGITELWRGPDGPVRSVCLITKDNCLRAVPIARSGPCWSA